MKRIIAIVILCLCLLTARAQSADERVGALLNAADWFELEREYPSLRDSIQTPFLRVMAEALTALYFNRDDKAVSAIDTLVARHQVTVCTGGSDVRLDYVAVMLDDIASVQIDDGNMGVNLIQNCHRATLNLKDMFLKIEN